MKEWIHVSEPFRAQKDPWGWSGPVVAASFLSGLITAARLSPVPFPRPWAEVEVVRGYYAHNTTGARISAAGQLLSAVSLTALTRATSTLAERSYPDRLWVRRAAEAGGAIAATSLAISGALAVFQTTGAMVEAPTVSRAHRAAFAAGGPVHGVGFAALTLVLAAASRRAGLITAPWLWLAMGAAAAGGASPAYFLSRPFGWLIPLGRMPGLVVAATAGVRLATARG